MFKEMKSRRLALLVAVALGGGGFLSSAQNVSAADVVIDDAHSTVAADHKVGADGAAGGAVTDPSGIADVADNTLTLTKHSFGGRLFGGYTAGNGNVKGNKVFIHNEATHVVQEKVYGGHANGSGNATGNTVTLTGGIFSDNIYGGSSVGGNATGNTVNLGDGTKGFAGIIHGTIYGGDGPGANNHVTGNVLNVNTNVIADNIKNFATINFNYNNTVNNGTMLHLNDNSNKRTSVDWNGIHLTGTPNKALTLMSNLKGIDISNYGGGITHLTLTDTHEGYVTPSRQIGTTRYQELNYEYNQFAGARKTVNSSNGTPFLSEVDVYGGLSAIGNTTTDNEVTITAAPGHGKVYGGYTEGDGTTAAVAKRYDSKGNKVTITGGAASELYGGYTSSAVGVATGNMVTVKGGTVRRLIYGGFAEHGDATGNTVNLGDAETGAVGNVSASKIFGGRSRDNTKDQTTGNTLNVNARTTAYNIENFAKINFNFKHVTGNTSLLTLTGTEQTKIKDLGMLNVQNVPRGEGSLLENTHGIVVSDYNGAVSKTYEKTETIIDKNGTTKIDYKGYQFKGARDSRTVGNATWGGRSVIGNTTTDNVYSVTNGMHTNVYGGWTSGTGSDAPADKQKNSTLNKIKVSGAANVTGKVYGGFTDAAGGNATGNEVTIEKSITGAVVGGKALGEASGNTVTIKANTGAVTGGEGATTNNNTVNLNGATVNGAITGGTQANGTGNTLNVEGRNSAASIGGFQQVKFNAANVAAGATMLNLTGVAVTTLHKDHIDATGSTVNGGITLLHNSHGINLTGYTSGTLKTETDATTEKNITVHKTGSTITDIKYEGFQFAGVTSASTGTDAYGGISKAGNSTHDNAITVNSNRTNVYGGYTAGSGTMKTDKDNSYNNTVTITGGTIMGKVYGGYTESATGTTTGNTVQLGDDNGVYAAGTTVAEVYGGNRSVKGNRLAVNAEAAVGKIGNFEKVAFKNASSKLTLTGGVSNFDLDAIEANFDATANPTLLVENTSGLTLKDGKAFRSELSTDGTKETNIEARAGNTKIVRYGYTIKGATSPTTLGTEMWGGRSAAGNTTTGNAIAVADATGKTVYGGYTSGTGTSATGADAGDSHTNTVNVAGGVYTAVYGGRTDVTGGKAVSNTVNVTQDAQGSIVGGYSASGEASNNVVDVTGHTFTGNITGGQGTVTNYNVIRLRNAAVTGTVTGGTAANGKDNTLAVSYGTGTSSSVKDFNGIQNLHFDMETAPVNNTNPLLKLTAVTGGDKNLMGMKFVVARSGATQKLAKGDTFTLMENTTGGGHNITVGSGVTAEGIDGVSRRYTFDITQDPHDAHKLIATVTKAGMGEQSKSIVETRAGASAFLNDGADFLAGAGMDAAGKEARAAAQNGSAPYGLWAGMGGGSFRHETGSYVDMKGWNLGVGWARENAVQAGTLTFGPFIEYGRGSYDSYLDDGTHGSGKTNYLGAGVMAKIETKAHNWVDSSLRIGRTKSDYTGLANYDTTSTYYGVQVGVGKDFYVRENDTVGAYVRYAYAHTAGTSAHLSSGETFDFDAVNSHRLRVGTRYTHGVTALSQLYAGLAWEYEFDGDARATSQGDSAPSPSLKGGSALLELGYRFAPQGSRMSYDLKLNGWQGKRKGVTGGVSVKWAF